MLRRFLVRRRRSFYKWIILCVFLLAGITYFLSTKTPSSVDSYGREEEGDILGDSVQAMRRKRYRDFQEKEKTYRRGPGERGAAVQLTPTEQKQANALFKKEAFNIIASDKIAMDRSLKDTRDAA